MAGTRFNLTTVFAFYLRTTFANSATRLIGKHLSRRTGESLNGAVCVTLTRGHGTRIPIKRRGGQRARQRLLETAAAAALLPTWKSRSGGPARVAATFDVAATSNRTSSASTCQFGQENNPLWTAARSGVRGMQGCYCE